MSIKDRLPAISDYITANLSFEGLITEAQYVIDKTDFKPKKRKIMAFVPSERKRKSLPPKAVAASYSEIRPDPLIDYLKKHSNDSFSEMLLKMIDKKGYLDHEVYNRANIDRRHFSKIRSKIDYKPTKATVMAFIVALCLNIDEAKDLLASAGYCFSMSSKFDLIIMYCIEEKIYDINEVNEALDSFGQPLLGGNVA